VIVFSGHGLHLYWLFPGKASTPRSIAIGWKTDLKGRPGGSEIGGDPAVCEIFPRLMPAARLPTTTKNSDWIPVRNEKPRRAPAMSWTIWRNGWRKSSSADC